MAKRAAEQAVEKASSKRSGGVTVNQAEINDLETSPTYSGNLSRSKNTLKPFFYFRNIGDYVEGFLGPRFDNRDIRRASSRLIETDDDIEEFFTNRQLAATIKKHELEGKYVRITFIGTEATGWGHKRKCYKVQKFPVSDREKITTQTGTPGRNKKRGSK